MDRKIKELADKLAACQAMCNYCFKACLGEKDVHMMVGCIELDKACAEICGQTLSLVASESVFAKEFVQLCAKVCEKCAEECGMHQVQHCQDCARACRECAEACRSFAA